MDKFNKEELEFHLPPKYKNKILKQVFDKELQKSWIPQIGDYIVGKTGNVFVISSITTLNADLGGKLYFFGGGLCVRDGGCKMNSTYSSCFNERGFIDNDFKSQVSKKEDYRYIDFNPYK